MSFNRRQATESASALEIKAARKWLKANYTEVDGWTIGQLGAQSVVHAVEREYDGGWVQFLLDTFPPLTDATPGVHYPLWESKGWLEQHSILTANMHDVDADLQDELYDAM